MAKVDRRAIPPPAAATAKPTSATPPPEAATAASVASTSPTCVQDGPPQEELPCRPQLVRLKTAGGSLVTQDTLSKRKPPRSPRLTALKGNLFSEDVSPVVISSVFFAIFALVEAGAVVAGSPLPPTPFAVLFYVSLILRVRYASHSDAALTWPVEKTAVFICIFDRWVFRPPGSGAMKRAIERLRAKAVRTVSARAIRNPVRAARIVRRVLRAARWLAWGAPLVGIGMGLKDHFGRFLIMRRQREEKRKRKAALQAMRAALDDNTSREEAAQRIQALYRGRTARRHVSLQRRSAQLRARAAAHKLLRAVHRHRARLQEKADQRPLLLRPDSMFVSLWKLGVLAMVLVDVAQVCVGVYFLLSALPTLTVLHTPAAAADRSMS